MPTQLDIDGSIHEFPDDWQVITFDESPTYRPVSGIGLKGCDVVGVSGQTLWLIEMKDYTYAGANPPSDLAQTVVWKAVNTLGLLAFWSRWPAESEMTSLARAAIACPQVNVGLHIELKHGRKKIPSADPLAAQLQRLKAVGKPLRANDFVVTSSLHPSPKAPWSSRRDPSTRDLHVDR